MVPTSLHYIPSRIPKLLLTLASVASKHVPDFRIPFSSYAWHSNATHGALAVNPSLLHSWSKRDSQPHDAKFIAFACLIPILVLASGLFAGLTLGYMSLDETQLNVLSVSGTPEQKVFANKIKPIRKDGHLLLVTLLLANMIVNETLPVISDPILGGGVQSVIVSTILIVIFAEIIPQSLCTRYGLYFGAKMAGIVNVLLWTLGLVAWPVARLLEFVLGPHHGIIYRRTELKELIAMHSSAGEHGGDLKTDTVTIIGGALDLQEKVVKQAMTPIDDVFMLSIDAKLDYDTLRKICMTGHSRIPVYEEVEVAISTLVAMGAAVDSREGLGGLTPDLSRSNPLAGRKSPPPNVKKVRKVIGILLVKQCVLLDPKDAVPVRNIPLNKVLFVPNNEPLLGILDRFQEGRSHMAIVSRYSLDRAVSVKKAVKRGLTQRLKDRVGMGDSDSSSDSDSDDAGTIPSSRKSKKRRHRKSKDKDVESDTETIRDSDKEDDGEPSRSKWSRKRGRSKKKPNDIEMGSPTEESEGASKVKGLRASLTLPRASFGRYEQSMPADAVLTEQNADEFLQGIDPAVMPLGLITLEDVLEELIGEEIYDEFDPQGHPDLSSYGSNDAKAPSVYKHNFSPDLDASPPHPVTLPEPNVPLVHKPMALPTLKNLNFKGLAFARSRSAPPTPRKVDKDLPADALEVTIDGNEEPEESKSVPHSPVEGIPDLQSALIPSGTGTPYGSEPVNTSERSISRWKPNSFAAPTIRAPIPVSAAAGLGVHMAAAAVSRSSSPASIEQAILIERKRRANAGTAAGPVPKGTRYKSSPLTGDRSGVVVAERIKRNMTPTNEMVVGDIRIPESKEKSGPDKSWY